STHVHVLYHSLNRRPNLLAYACHHSEVDLALIVSCRAPRPPSCTLFPYTTLFRSHERQKQPYGRQHTYHHYRTQRPAYEKTESLPRARCGYPSAYGSQALGIEKEKKCHKPQ